MSRKRKDKNKMKTTNVLRNENLWQRIQGFSIDAENVAFPFSKKLAKEENWTPEFTEKAIEEYKKFVYLCCISPNGASPSEIVDKVWHLHLIYTQNYWEDFCPNILKRNLHHHPSNGGTAEVSKHKSWFTETLENYREVFSYEAPEEIWKNQKRKSKNFWFRSLRLFPVASILLVLGSCSDHVSNVLITIFVVIFTSFLLIYIIGRVFEEGISKNKENNVSNNNGESGSSCSGGSSSCSGGSSCGSGCGGGGCGGCGS